MLICHVIISIRKILNTHDMDYHNTAWFFLNLGNVIIDTCEHCHSLGAIKSIGKLS